MKSKKIELFISEYKQQLVEKINKLSLATSLLEAEFIARTRSEACINRPSSPIYKSIFFALELMRNFSANTIKPSSWLRVLILASRSVGVIKSAPLKQEIFPIC